MAGVTGIGGVFFRSADPAALQAWYEKHLGIESDNEGYVVFRWGGGDAGSLVWAPFPADTSYFGSDEAEYMINYRVEDLDSLIARLEAAGVRVDERRHEDENGRFGWAWDPEGHRFELWEPAPGM